MRTTVVYRAIACVLILGLALVPPGPARADDKDCPYHKLKWDDFKGDPPTNGKDAETDGGVADSWNTDTPVGDSQGGWTCKLKDVKVHSYMDKTQSGVKPDAKTDALLQHEQYHMDIYEIWARELEKALKGIVGKGSTARDAVNDAKAQAKKAEEENKQKCMETQKKYDDETKDGTDADKQKAWCEKIGNLLNPPPPKKDALRSSQPGQGAYNPGTNEFRIQSFFDVFTNLDVPIDDPFLRDSQFILPPLDFQGFFMDKSMPLLMPADPMAAQAVLVTRQGVPVLQGNLRLQMGSGALLTGWVESVEIQPDAMSQSPMLRLFERDLATGAAVLTFEIVTPSPLEVLTNGFTQPATMPLLVQLGTVFVATVSGNVTLQHCLDRIQPITFEFRPADGSSPFTRSTALNADGAFFFNDIPPGAYYLAIKGDRWLRRVIPLHANGDVSGVTAALLAGDINNDNVVDDADYQLLRAAFRSRPGDANWNPQADLNCDGVVDEADLRLLQSNFGQAGDP
jgi:Dockerin type I domain/Bacterial protein of unknown function (DUF922)